ncbi:MAG: tetratricopeptide repeat protein [Bacteroidota bacterium]
MIRTSFIPLLLLLLCATGWSQEQITEEDINQESMLIEANREKLLGNYDKAITILRELFRQDSDNTAVAYELGRLLHAEGNLEEAIRYLKTATEQAPDNEWYLKFLADIYQREGRNRDGAELYEKLVEQSPEDQYLAFRLAYFLVRAQEIDKAIKVYEDLEKEIGLNEEIARRKHALFLGMGDTKRAGRTLEDLVEAYPKVVSYKHLLANFYESQGDENAARKVYEQIVAQNPDDPKAQLALAGGSNIRQDELRYLADLRPAFERSDVDVDLKISKLYPFITQVAETGDPVIADAALELTTIMEDLHNSDPKPFSAAGDLLYHSGRKREAIAKYKATLERDENVFPVWEQLLVSLYETGDAKGLYDAANDALDVFPNRAVVQYYLAIGADAGGEYDDALDAVSMATMMSGRNPNLRAEVRALEGQILSHQNDQSGARSAFAEAMDLAPNSPDVNYRYADYLLNQNQIDQALEAAQKAVAAQRTHPYYAEVSARIAYRQEDFEAAQEWIAIARNQGAKYWPQALELSGDIQFQLKNIEQAVTYWEQARALGENSQRLLDKIANRSL